MATNLSIDVPIEIRDGIDALPQDVSPQLATGGRPSLAIQARP